MQFNPFVVSHPTKRRMSGLHSFSFCSRYCLPQLVKSHLDGGHYAYGWIDWQREWADGRVLWHNGSNTLWYALVMLVPSRNAVLVIVTNDGYLAKAQPEFFNLAESIVKELPKPK